jgi:vacuolar-type H+-ATPase subunit E/Vma4
MKIDEKLAFFAKLAEQEAQSLRTAIMADIEDQMGKALSDIQREAERKAHQRITSERYKIEQMKNKEVIKASLEAKKAAVDLRSRLLDELFSNVLNTVLEFTKSPEYGKKLVEEAKELSKKHGNVQIALMERDMGLADELSGYADCVSTDEDFIGGFQLIFPERNAMEDHTYLTRLKEAKAEFNELKFEGGAAVD